MLCMAMTENVKIYMVIIYKLFVTIIGEPISNKSDVKFGMVMDFDDLKKIVKSEIINEFDHSVIFNKNSPHKELADELIKNGHKVILANYQPTIEEMIVDFCKTNIFKTSC